MLLWQKTDKTKHLLNNQSQAMAQTCKTEDSKQSNNLAVKTSAEIPFDSFPFYKETTQIEDPRKQWRQEQERMLKDYLMVAQDALSTQKELYQVKEQRLALALDEYVRLNDAYKEKSSSRTSCKYSRKYNVTSLICALQGILFHVRMGFQGLL